MSSSSRYFHLKADAPNFAQIRYNTRSAKIALDLNDPNDIWFTTEHEYTHIQIDPKKPKVKTSAESELEQTTESLPPAPKFVGKTKRISKENEKVNLNLNGKKDGKETKVGVKSKVPVVPEGKKQNANSKPKVEEVKKQAKKLVTRDISKNPNTSLQASRSLSLQNLSLKQPIKPLQTTKAIVPPHIKIEPPKRDVKKEGTKETHTPLVAQQNAAKMTRTNSLDVKFQARRFNFGREKVAKASKDKEGKKSK